MITKHAMPVFTEHIEIVTQGKGTYEISDKIRMAVSRSGLRAGTVTVFARHTSCSLVIMENADPSAREDLHAYFERMVPEGASYFVHTSEGLDDMPSHIRAVWTGCSEVVPFVDGRLLLGTWQGIFVFEHRRATHRRRIVVTVIGE